MALLHDVEETRSGDRNYIQREYTKVFKDKIFKEQLKGLPFDDFADLMEEYEAKQTKESLVVKDADMLDQVLLLKEYAHQGNKEAQKWLEDAHNISLQTNNAKKLLDKILMSDVTDWWREFLS